MQTTTTITEPTPAELLTAALGYARRGFAVLPLHSWRSQRGACTCQGRGQPLCKSPAKHPLTAEGLKDATTDPALVGWWWDRWPNANIGILTGRASGVWVLDIDDHHGGADSLADLTAVHGPLPETATVLTGGGGAHYYWAMPPWSVGNAVGVLPGIDIRGDGGYVVAPPSRHRSGRPYAHDAGMPADAVPAPDWLYTVLREAARAARSAPLPEIFTEGMRDNALASAGGALRRRGLGEKAILAALGAINETCARPPLAAADVARIARSVCRYAPPGQDGGPKDWQPHWDVAKR